MTEEKSIRPYIETDISEDVDGSNGSNRAPEEGLLVRVHNDREAIGYFLEQYSTSPGTLRIYSREVERFALWAFHVKNKAVSSISATDVEQYITFLANPVPASLWCGPKAPRETPEWRPFVKGIEVNARLAALSAINSMFGYWVQIGYLRGNPLGVFRKLKEKIINGELGAAGVKPKRKSPRAAVVIDQGAKKIERFFDQEMWDATVQSVQDMHVEGGTNEANAEYERARFMMAMLFMLAPRVSEIETHCMNSFVEEGGHWWWYVVGKGAKLGKVAVPDQMLEALIRYRLFLGLTAVPTPNDDSPLLRNIRHPGESITARRLNQILKEIFGRAADKLPKERIHIAEKLRKASAHWGRHTSITNQVQSGMDYLHVQRNARHKNFATTEFYIHDNENKRHEDSQKMEFSWK